MEVNNCAKVEEHYRKYPKIQKCSVEKLQKWIHDEPHLPNITEMESFMFLHACSYDEEAAKKRMDTYYTFRTHCPEFYSDRNVLGKDLKTAMEIITFVPLPGLTLNGNKVMYFRFNTEDPSKFVVSQAMKLLAICMESIVMKEGMHKGYIILVDMKNYTIGHIAKLELLTIRKCMIYLQEGLPVRLRGFHFINAPNYIDKLMSLMRPFMRKSFDENMKFHFTLEDAYKTVPQKMFPKDDLGGEANTRDQLKNEFYDYIIKNSKVFLEEEATRRVNEKKRPCKPKSAMDLFGACGLLSDVEQNEDESYTPTIPKGNLPFKVGLP